MLYINSPNVDYNIFLTEQGPICQSSKMTNTVIGPNSCGIEPDNLVLTCTVQYHGNEVPILEWRNLVSNDTISKGITRGSNDTYVTLSLTMTVDNSIDDTSYLCQTIISTPDPYSCQIGPIVVQGKCKQSYVDFPVCQLPQNFMKIRLVVKMSMVKIG